MQSPLNITISASIQTPAFPQCSAANCSLHTVFFSAGTRDSKRCPQDSCKRDAGTGPVHTHTHTHSQTRVPSGPLPGMIWEVHMHTCKHILFLSHNLALFFLSLSQRHRHLVNQAVNWSLLLKQSQDKGSLSESTLQNLYGASREHESINRRITLEMLVNSPHTHPNKFHTHKR